MSDRTRDSETQSLRPGSDPREIARQARQRLNAEHPTQIGPYRILQPLGEGGMGTVYLAEQSKPVHRKVALKIIKLGMDTKSVIARFEAEREALALMNHPNVAKVFDAGATDTGRPYFVMEYVEGVPLTQFCDDKRLTLHERLNLFMQVCQAVQHAHQKGIIHRDLKPSNVLVAAVDEKPSVKVIDFGIAKATQQKLTEQTFATEQGMLVGTPAYMSPEQADPFTRDIDTRTDIYSLGVILYELLVGTLPFEPDSLRKAALSEIQRIIREVDPPKPSSRVGARVSEPRASEPRLSEPRASASGSSSPDATQEPLPHGRGSDPDRGLDLATIASHRGTDPKSLHRQIRGELDWIVMKCLEKDRARRYDTANALVMELQRFLNNEPVLAGPPSGVYRFKKFIRRNRAAVLGATAVSAVLILGIVTTSVMLVRARTAEARERAERLRAEEGERNAENARAAAEQVTQFLTETLGAADPGKEGREVTVREVMDKAADRVGDKFSNKPLIEARLRQTIGWTYLGLGLFEPAQAHLAESAAIYTRKLGPRDPQTLNATSLHAAVVVEQGHFSKAEASQRSTMEIQRRVLGEEHPETIATMNNLAVSFHKQGRYTEAEELFRQVLEIRRRVLGTEHVKTCDSMSNLAVSLSDQGRYAEAETLHRRSLEIRRRVLGEEHPAILQSMHSLAISLHERGRYAEAETLYRQTLEIQRRVLGEEHPDPLLSMINLANTLDALARSAEAETLRRQTLEIQRRVLGKEHPDTLVSLANLASTLCDQGRYAEAETLSRQTLEIQRRVQGEEHPHTLTSMSGLAISLHERGRYAEAEELFRQTLEIQRRVLGAEHPHTLTSMNHLASSLHSQGRNIQAEELYRKVLEIQRRVLGEEHRDVASTMYNLGVALERAQRWKEAEPLCRQAGSIWAASLSAEHRNRRDNANLLGDILAGLGRFAEAEPLLIESYRASENDAGLIPADRKAMLDRFVRLYEPWDAAEPGKGYAEKAAEWRAKLAEFNAANRAPALLQEAATSDESRP